MAESIGSAASGHPNLNLTPEETKVYGQLLKEADPDGFGAVSGDVAVKFFEKTKLPADVLGQIWQIADTENRGFLTPAGFGVVLRLIAHAQAGRGPSTQIMTQPAPMPRFEGHNLFPLTAQTTGQTPGSPAPSSPSQQPPGPLRVPPLSPEKVSEYSSLFEKSGAENSMLPGVVAKQIFERARLPNEVLGRIWGLSDTQGRGALDVTEFVIAMHLLASYKSGAMRGVPNTLPLGLYEAAARRPPTRMNSRPSSDQFGPSAIQQQSTGLFNARPQSPIVRQQAGTPLSSQSTGEGWLVTPADKARFDQIFTTVDKGNKGYITGEEAVGFFGNARLPEEVLAQVWDLSDINSQGQLSKEEFAVAMYLIRQQRTSKDGRSVIPSALPLALIPPNMRKQAHPPSHPTAPAFDNAPVTKPPSAADDLFGLDAFVSGPTASNAPQQIAQSTGGTDAGPFANSAMTQSPQVTGLAAQQSGSFKPFVPTSSFGQSIIPQASGSGGPGLSRSVAVPSGNDDLLGDADPEVSQRLTNETTELANISNQVGNLSRQMTELQGTRGQAEQELSRNAQQKREFEGRLAQLRTAYEREVKEVKSRQEQLASSRNDTKRLQQDMAMIDGTHQDLQTQHNQLRNALQTDQQENASLKERMKQINMEVEQMKPQVEKLKSDARQQKGLVAINKKQLATNESERDKIRAEIDAARKDIEEALHEVEESKRQLTQSQSEIEESRRQLASSQGEAEESRRKLEQSRREAEESRRQLEQAQKELQEARAHNELQEAQAQKELQEARSVPTPAAPLPAAPLPPVVSREAEPPQKELEEARNVPLPSVASPTPSTSSNPFFRRAQSTMSEGPRSPFQEEPRDNRDTFDSIFGPSFSSNKTAAPAPSTSFRSEGPGTGHDISLPQEASRGTEDLSRSTDFDDTSGVSTPPASAATHTQHMTQSDPFEMSGPDEEQDSVQRALPHADQGRSNFDDTFGAPSAEIASDIPGAFPDSETPRSATLAHGVSSIATAIGAGVATLAAGVGLGGNHADSREAESKGKEPDVEKPASGSKEDDFDQYFGGPAHQRTPSQQISDFDSAFASMNKQPAPNGAARSANPEFPDIQELDDDEEEESDYSEETPMGFEDNFGARSQRPAVPAGSKAAGKQPEVASAVPTHMQANEQRPQLGTAQSNASLPPDAEQQKSPPTYGESVPNDNPTHFPREYKGLLPEREDPTAPPPTAGGSTQPAPPPMGQPPAYGPEATARSASQSESTAPPPTMAAPFDFDSAFAGTGAAPVEDDDEDDDYEKVHAGDFDPTFDTPSHTRSTTAASQPQPSIYSAVTSGSADTPTSPTTSNFYSFYNSTAQAPPQTSTVPTANAGATAPASASHDWDDLFQGLSAPPPRTGIDDFGFKAPPQTQANSFGSRAPPQIQANNFGSSGPPQSQANNFGSSAPPPRTGTDNFGFSAPPQTQANNYGPSSSFAPPPRGAPSRNTVTEATAISPNAAATTTAFPVSDQSTPSKATMSPMPTSPPPQTSTTTNLQPPPRPELSRVMSGEDDPILQRLTAMGWQRDESLQALEKFDYNIDKAADWLTFKS